VEKRGGNPAEFIMLLGETSLTLSSSLEAECDLSDFSILYFIKVNNNGFFTTKVYLENLILFYQSKGKITI
jgi:hypothetical protein